MSLGSRRWRAALVVSVGLCCAAPHAFAVRRVPKRNPIRELDGGLTQVIHLLRTREIRTNVALAADRAFAIGLLRRCRDFCAHADKRALRALLHSGGDGQLLQLSAALVHHVAQQPRVETMPWPVRGLLLRTSGDDVLQLRGPEVDNNGEVLPVAGAEESDDDDLELGLAQTDSPPNILRLITVEPRFVRSRALYVQETPSGELYLSVATLRRLHSALNGPVPP